MPLQKGFLYLAAIVDLFSRHVLSWKLSNSLDMEFCLEALELAVEGGRMPEIFHSDQGCQFTSADFVSRLQTEKIRISWSGRKRLCDSIMVERLWRTWRTVKYEDLYLLAYNDGCEARTSLACFLSRCCHVSPHSSLGGRTPHKDYNEHKACPAHQGLTISGATSVH
jgi:putative transposase